VRGLQRMRLLGGNHTHIEKMPELQLRSWGIPLIQGQAPLDTYLTELAENIAN